MKLPIGAHAKKTPKQSIIIKANLFLFFFTPFCIIHSPVLIIDADRLSWLNIDIIMVAGTFGHGDTDAMFVQIETLSTRATIHR